MSSVMCDAAFRSELPLCCIKLFVTDLSSQN